MSERNDASGNARIVPGKATPTPDYQYQRYDGKSGSASANPSASPARKFAELQNFVMPSD